MKFRKIDTGYGNGPWNMAVDEAILRRVSEGKSPPALRFYRWQPSAVTIGYFQKAEDEVNIPFCRKNKIDIIRRQTGGGAVFHDSELTYTIIFREDSKLVSKNIIKSYEEICSGIITGLKYIGIDAKFAPINDILVSGKKISGNAQTRRMGCVLQHGTILIDVDYDKMFSVLNISKEKIKSKGIESAKERVGSLNQCFSEIAKKNGGLAHEKNAVEFELKDAIIMGFERNLNIVFEESVLTEEEIKLTEEILKEKYLSDKWNFMR